MTIAKKITTPQGPLTMLNTNVRQTITMEGPTICSNRYEMTMAIKECAKHQPLKMQNKKTAWYTSKSATKETMTEKNMQKGPTLYMNIYRYMYVEY